MEDICGFLDICWYIFNDKHPEHFLIGHWRVEYILRDLRLSKNRKPYHCYFFIGLAGRDASRFHDTYGKGCRRWNQRLRIADRATVEALSFVFAALAGFGQGLPCVLYRTQLAGWKLCCIAHFPN